MPVDRYHIIVIFFFKIFIFFLYFLYCIASYALFIFSPSCAYVTDSIASCYPALPYTLLFLYYLPFFILSQLVLVDGTRRNRNQTDGMYRKSFRALHGCLPLFGAGFLGDILFAVAGTEYWRNLSLRDSALLHWSTRAGIFGRCREMVRLFHTGLSAGGCMRGFCAQSPRRRRASSTAAAA